jgi:hypothetical protein
MGTWWTPPDGEEMLDIRQWVKLERAGGWVRTGRGITIPSDLADGFLTNLDALVTRLPR